MKKKLLFPALLSLTLALAGVAAAWAFGPNGAPDTNASFVMAEDDGYGINTCVSGSRTGCGQDLADSWCLANGYVHAVAIRKAEALELVQPISGAQARSIQPGETLITCEK